MANGNLANVFASDIFSFSSLTTAINLIPEKPYQLGTWFKWNAQGVNTETIIVEENSGRLTVIPTSARGTNGRAASKTKRKARSFVVPHYAHYDSIMAAQIQGVRQFGSDDVMETVQSKLAEANALMRGCHDVTEEFAKAGVVQSVLFDADGTILYDWHDEFGVERNDHQIDFSDPSIDVRAELVKAKRKSEIAVGGTILVVGYKLVCTSSIFDAITTHPSVKSAFDRWQDGAFLRADNRKGFMIADDIEVVSYHNAKVGDVDFLQEGDAFLVPNSDGLFQVRFAPADTMEAANTIGLPLYEMAEPMAFGRGVDLATESNAIYYNPLPRAIVRIQLN